MFTIKLQTAAAALSFALLLAITPALALETGAAAPKFVLKTIDGKQTALDDFKGQVVVLKIGTTWCPGCQTQSRELQKVDELLQAQGVTLVEVFVDESAGAVKRYQKDYPLQTPAHVLLGNDAFTSNYGVYSIPRLLILDPQLKVVIDSGGLMADEIKARLLQLKAGKPGK